MSFAFFACSISAFWLIVHILQRVLGPKDYGPILPSYRLSPQYQVGTSSDYHVNLRFLQAQIATSRWNIAHDKLLIRLKRRNMLWLRVWLTRFYTLGYISGLIGMAAAFGLLIWTMWTLMPSSIHNVAKESETSGKLMKRASLSMSSPYAELTLESPITPILPGVTVPLSHIPVILVVLFLSQVVHELGHAIAGALYSIPIVSSGASLTVCIPSAFVSFTSSTFDTLRPSAKSRVIAAGPFHNLIFCCFWIFSGYIGTGIFFTILGYKDVSSLGRVIVSVEDTSPLAGYLAPGTVVTKLNDQSMASSIVDPDPWGSFLQSPQNDEMNLGWCVDAKEFGSSSRECCLPDEDLPTSLSCFVADTIPNEIGCLDPVPILTSLNSTLRCSLEAGCRDGYLCLRPSEKEALLRLTVKEYNEQLDKVVLWSGPRREIWDEVVVGKWLPRLSILPVSLPSWASIFWEYMVMVNLSLFLFNLVPIGGLDGLHFLRTVFASLMGGVEYDAYDLEAMERVEVAPAPGSGVDSRRGILEKVVSGGAGFLVGMDIVLIVLALIRT